MFLLEEGFIILRNWIFFKHGLSDIIEETTRYDTIKADEGNFFVCNGILLNKLPEKVANVAQYDETTTNHTGVHT